jgi:TRAP-type C4-dicarboxylate transport system permease small subunit
VSTKHLSKRRLKKQLRYAAAGTAIGLIASLVLILGTIMIVRFSIGKHIGHRVPFGFVLFILVLVFMVYRLMHLEPEPRRSTRSVTYGAVTELSERDKTKSA